MRRGVRRGQAGFTLLELMVALAVLALVVTGFLGAFRELLASTAEYESESASRQAARQIFGVMVNDLRSATDYKSGTTSALKDMYRFAGHGYTGELQDEDIVLELSTAAGLDWDAGFPSHGLQQVRYVLRRDSGDRDVVRLFRASRPHAGVVGEWGWNAIELFDDVRFLEITFLEMADSDPLERWDSVKRQEADPKASRYPALVRIRLGLPGFGDVERVFETDVRMPRVQKEQE
ncbi:type II secretion system protein J [Desulfobaculum xiamenense]|uniref:Type II secretion system protein J n=1 Tax=Desulfobaculum xiamenense TaxID=995050 RepID=A0A846QP20_9BACT|nr:prepilin-type N-terminal cleavage/methylation domain-containing protein [Desulfobaculum xiamenense]NJB68760.1 type II secretion system protein J [Desulfobaculum xiamenense]